MQQYILNLPIQSIQSERRQFYKDCILLDTSNFKVLWKFSGFEWHTWLFIEISLQYFLIQY